MTSTIYDSIAQDPFLQKAKEELEAIDVQINAISDKKQKTLEDKVKQDALINKWAKLQTKYNRAINSILESAEA
jgi:hypothetical protein